MKRVKKVGCTNSLRNARTFKRNEFPRNLLQYYGPCFIQLDKGIGSEDKNIII